MKHPFLVIILVLFIALFLSNCVSTGINYQPEELNEPASGPVTADTDEQITGETPAVFSDAVYPQTWATGSGTINDPWAGDCLDIAYTNCPVNGTIYLRAGYYLLDNRLNIAKKINLIGEVVGDTIIKTPGGIGIFINSIDRVTLKSFTIDGSSQVDGKQYIPLIQIVNCDDVLLEDIEVKNGGDNGIGIYQVNHSTFENIYAHDNYEHGVHPGSDTAGRNIYNTYRNIYTWNNSDSGFDDRGIGKSTGQTNNRYYNIQSKNNGNHGIAITYQSGIILSNSSAKGNINNGIYIRGIEDSSADNCSVNLNGSAGILFAADVKDVDLTNVIVKNNKTGISIYNSSELAFHSCQAYDDRTIPLQNYGIELRETNTGISVSNCKLLPNEFGDIYNPNNVAINYKAL